MSVKVAPLTVEAVASTCLAPFARRLQAYGYAPAQVQRIYGTDHRGLPRAEAYYRFIGGDFRITFYVARNSYRFAVHDGAQIVFVSRFECSPMHLEPAFLAVYRDTEPLEPPPEPIQHGRRRRAKVEEPEDESEAD